MRTNFHISQILFRRQTIVCRFELLVIRKFWRQWGALICVPLLISFWFINNQLYGVMNFIMLTVPCGIPKVNKNWYLWFSRQFIFLMAGLVQFL